MYKVKVTVANGDKGFNRQLPGGKHEWKNYRFYINENIQEADFWVVCYQKLLNRSEKCNVSPENTLFITWEPDSVYHFSHGFLNQFSKVISCQQRLKHRNLVQDQPGLAWHIGQIRNNNSISYTKLYDDFKYIQPEKSKLISVISSNKAFTKGHRQRIEFVQKLKAHFGDQLDVFGRGINDFEDKWDVIAPYKYHICIENCSIPYYWSEKLADSFLGNSYPFYYGCSNVFDYFDYNALRTIDINRPEMAIEIIENAIKDNVAEIYSDTIEKSKQLVLDKYNFFDLVVRNIQDMNPNAKKCEYEIKQDMYFFDIAKLPLYSSRLLSNFKYRFSK